MTISRPKNTYGLEGRNFPIYEDFSDMQRIIVGAHKGESKQKTKPTKILVPVENFKKFNENKQIFEEFFEWLTDRQIQFEFSEISKHKRPMIFGDFNFDFVSLFSGGLDSGSLPLIDEFRNSRGLLHHTHTSHRMYHVAREVYQKCIPKNHKISFSNLDLESTADIPLLHIRGVTFLTNLLCIAAEHGITKVIIPENGPLMINYPVASTVSPTRTANPDMIQKWTEIFKKITNAKIKVQTPFINKTKSEVILMSKTKTLIEHTWSCSTSQGISKMCGICMACFVRILSLYAIDLDENINSRYLYNPFKISSSTLKESRMTTFRILINCLEFWKNIIQHDEIKNNIEKERFENLAKKYPILEKFSLDMYVGIQNYLKNNNDSEILGKTSMEYLNIIDNKILEMRQKALQRLRKKYGWIT
ncbi:MAG: 7-cyano-7-deazaguanine synthase [Nitrosopumilus sp.]|uniref:7-cyano-7-deazaguanine synthase n=1 Tax=Nitrosopumilus sp. TaxID=2024843 RepID=UPI00247D4C5F|nr:7-cyano-7-deazaguanine synthase [Nitrosopumilus sp.]MCV0392007.1 7-cyano-7-deazaguanine synthase [Nitrosopumilus sp.]